MVNTDPFFQTRRIKDHSEIRIISRAAGILDKLYQICEEEIKVGLSERDLQANLIQVHAKSTDHSRRAEQRATTC